MSPLERAIEEQRQALDRVEQRAAADTVRAYQAVLRRMRAHLAALTRDIEAARRAGIEVRPGWLFSQERYLQLVADLERETVVFAARSLNTVQGAQRAAIAVAIEHGRQLVRTALGPAPRGTVARVTASLDRLNAAALERLVGFASDGRPLGLLIAELNVDGPQRVRDALAFGVASGRGTRIIAREVEIAANIPLTRALTITRTEMIRASREAADDTYARSGVATGWEWAATLDTRTCASCWAQHGSRHPLGEPLESHPNCRCAKIPVTLSWAELGFPDLPDDRPRLTPGPDVFADLPEGDKLAILGRAKLDAYNAGEITLEDLVQRTISPRWGAGSREATLAEARA